MSAMTKADDVRWMRIAIDLAKRGIGRVEPNPPVGAVLVHDGVPVGFGFHRSYGGPHAEVNAILQAGEKTSRATLYVTLEPCSTTGKTPPCVDRIVKSGLKRVVVGVEDPFPAHRGRGLHLLRNRGVVVEIGVLHNEAGELLREFRRQVEDPFPFIVAKWAMTLDGKTATRTGDSKWISSEASRRRGHRERRECDAVLIGIGTLLADNPELTVRLVAGSNRTRIVADSSLRIPLDCRLLQTARETPTWVLAAEDVSRDRIAEVEGGGARVILTPRQGAHLDLEKALSSLRDEGIHKLLLEGGGELAASAFETGVVRRVIAFVAPILSGGLRAATPFGGLGVARMVEAHRLHSVRVRMSGPDILVRGEISRAGGRLPRSQSFSSS